MEWGVKRFNTVFWVDQMTERLAIIGGCVQFSGEDGFATTIHIPKIKGEEE